MRRMTATKKGQSHMHEQEVVLERRLAGAQASGHGLHRCSQGRTAAVLQSALDENVPVPLGTGRGAWWRHSWFCRRQRWRR
jgi:hypothetical protein